MSYSDFMSKLSILHSFLIYILAINFLTSCLSPSKSKQSAVYKVEIANSFMNGKNYPAALKELLSAEQDDPKNAQVQEYLGHVYLARERVELAEKHYLNALELDPNFTDVRNSLARLYIDTGRLNKSEEFLKVAMNDLTYIPYHRTLANYGVLEFKRKNFSKAAEYFKKSLEKDRENCDTNIYLGRSFLEGKDLEFAIQQFERSISFCSQINSDAAHYYSAISLYRKNEVARAQTRFEELIKLYPEGFHSEKARKMLSLIKSETP
jgi:type IV pilus assembly protein PilF